jgi:hypothetical protein
MTTSTLPVLTRGLTSPNSPEIQSQLLLGQNFTDIPAVVCRAFHGRLSALKAFIWKSFDGLLYEICVTEFQKRGLPRAHIVIKGRHELPFSQLDSFISAELPDPVEKSALVRGGKTASYPLARPLESSSHLSRMALVATFDETEEGVSFKLWSCFSELLSQTSNFVLHDCESAA